MKNRIVVIITAEQMAQIHPERRVGYTKRLLAESNIPVDIDVRTGKHTLKNEGKLSIEQLPNETRYERVWYTP